MLVFTHDFDLSPLATAFFATKPAAIITDAFADPAVIAAGLSRHQLASGHLVVIRRLHGNGYNNVVMQIGEELPKPADQRHFSDSTTEEQAELVFVATRTGRAARDALAKGREHFRETALTEVADKLQPDVLEKLFYTCLRDVFREMFGLELNPTPASQPATPQTP